MNLFEYIGGNPYPGRGVLLGSTKDALVSAYFIMGRSTNSRNRVFVQDGDGIRTKAHNPALLSDPSLVIYEPVRVLRDTTIVTNGDQTDTICDLMSSGGTFEQALRTREYEPDAPNFTPRISGLLSKDGYTLSILKHDAGTCQRFFYEYAHVAGTGHIIHTYKGDGEPLPSFKGEPAPVELDLDIDAFTDKLWNALDGENKVSLFVRYAYNNSGNIKTKIINKLEG